mgnify:CR=1 FL=1
MSLFSLCQKRRRLWLVVAMTVGISGCSTYQPTQTNDVCKIFWGETDWYKDARKSSKRWGTPIAIMMAIINQESSFNQFAKPKRKRLLGLIPGKRPSTAFGYAQVTNPTWQWYRNRTGNMNASRANFKDITDFIGWYAVQTNKMLGISMNDFYNQYLAYHEGQAGWGKKSFNSKSWLLKAAKKVETNANKYNNQLKDCEKRLNKKGLFGLF